jgi:hypothetical protein
MGSFTWEVSTLMTPENWDFLLGLSGLIAGGLFVHAVLMAWHNY